MTGDPDFEAIIRGSGEAANTEDLIILEQVARSLAETVPAEVIKRVNVYSSATDATIAIGTTQYEQIGSETFVSLEISRDTSPDYLFVTSYDLKNILSTAYYRDDGDLADARVVIEELLEDVTDSRIIPLLHFLKTQLAYVAGEGRQNENELDILKGVRQVHVADYIRSLISDYCGENRLIIHEYEGDLDKETSVYICTHELVTDKLADDTDPPALLIELVDEPADQKYTYYKLTDGTTRLEIGKPSEDDIDITKGKTEEQEDDPEEVSDFLQLLNENKPRRKEVELLTRALLDASLDDMRDELDRSEAADFYPELSFGFNPSEFVVRGRADPKKATHEIINGLQNTLKYQLPNLGDSPNQHILYSYNSNLAVRANKFLATRISKRHRGCKDSAKRSEIVAIEATALDLLDQLAGINHPVAQALAQFCNEYDDTVDSLTQRQITIEVLKQTHWAELRRKFNRQVSSWRCAALTTKAAVDKTT